METNKSCPSNDKLLVGMQANLRRSSGGMAPLTHSYSDPLLGRKKVADLNASSNSNKSQSQLRIAKAKSNCLKGSSHPLCLSSDVEASSQVHRTLHSSLGHNCLSDVVRYPRTLSPRNDFDNAVSTSLAHLESAPFTSFSDCHNQVDFNISQGNSELIRPERNAFKGLVNNSHGYFHPSYSCAIQQCDSFLSEAETSFNRGFEDLDSDGVRIPDVEEQQAIDPRSGLNVTGNFHSRACISSNIQGIADATVLECYNSRPLGSNTLSCVSIRHGSSEVLRSEDKHGWQSRRNLDPELSSVRSQLKEAHEDQLGLFFKATQEWCVSLVLRSKVPKIEDKLACPVEDESINDAELKLRVKKEFVKAMDKLQQDQLPTKRRGNLPKESIAYLKEWFDSHSSHPCMLTIYIGFYYFYSVS